MAILNMGSGGGGVRIPLEPASDFELVPRDQAVRITWTDPVDKVASPGGELVSEWAYTIVIRKEGSAPTSPVDGVQIIKETTRNQYSENYYTDSNLVNGSTYYYAAYSYSTIGTVSEPAVSPVVPKTGVPVYYKALSPFRVSRSMFAPGTVSDKYLFAGGYVNNRGSNYVDVYDSSLSRSNITIGVSAFDMRPADLPSYFVCIGGRTDSDSYNTYRHYAISESLTSTSISNWNGDVSRSSQSVSIGTHAILPSGTITGTSSAYALSDDLTSQQLEDMSYCAEYSIGGARAGENAVFAGGYDYDAYGDNDYVRSASAYNSALTKVSIGILTYNIKFITGASIGGNAIFVGEVYPNSGANTRTAEAYDENLTHIAPSSITPPPAYTKPEDYMPDASLYGITLGAYAMFGGWKTMSVVSDGTTYDSIFCLYDENLTYMLKENLIPSRSTSFIGAVGKDPYGIYVSGNNIVDAFTIG